MQKFSVVQTVRNCRSFVERGEFTLGEAYKIAVNAHTEFEKSNQPAVIEIVFIKDNGQHGDTISKFIVEAKG